MGLWVLLIIALTPATLIYAVKTGVVIMTIPRRNDPATEPVPSIVHFVVGQQDKQGVEMKHASAVPFVFFNYITMLAARRHLRPSKLIVHYDQEPNTTWWYRAKHDPEIDMVLVQTRAVERVFNRTVDNHSHRSDVIRLEAMMQYGGIYLDIDVLVLRSFGPLMNLSDVVMAHENDDRMTAGSAVIISKRNAAFIRRWYDAYQSFNQSCWICHAVQLPGKLAAMYPNEIRVLPTRTFLRPSWHEKDIFLQANGYNFSGSYATHLWNSLNNDLLKGLTPEYALTSNSTLARMLRQAVGEDTFRKLYHLFPDKRVDKNTTKMLRNTLPTHHGRLVEDILH